MRFNKSSLTEAQSKTYSELVANLKGAADNAERQAARVIAMIPGDGDLMYVPGAIAAAEAEAGLWISGDELDDHMKSFGQSAGQIRINPLA